jgi:hypothetical protein
LTINSFLIIFESVPVSKNKISLSGKGGCDDKNKAKLQFDV